MWSVRARSAAVLSTLLVPIASADIIVDWAEVTLDAIRVNRTAPPLAARAMAMVGIAMYDSVNYVADTHDPYLDLSDVNISGGISKEAAAAAAAHRVLSSLYPDLVETFDAALDASLSTVADGSNEDNGVALGRAVADKMIALRADDGADAMVAYEPSGAPDGWQPTPPAFQANPALPQWPYVKPICLEDVSALRRKGPPSLDSAEYTQSFNEVKALGAADSTVRTAEQTTIAFFWVDGPGTATPPGHWWQIARDIAAQQGNTFEQNARLFALIGMAVCDAGICSWDNKYYYDHWRPVTAIRAAADDGNPDTEPDPDWTSLIPTPPFPSYTSGHSTFSGSASKILALFYGTDEIEFSTTSDDVPGVTRSFARFSAAGDEAGRSRIYGGIHWEYDNQDALATGRELAVQIYNSFLQERSTDVIEVPVDELIECGPFGIVPFTMLTAGLLGIRTALPRRRR